MALAPGTRLGVYEVTAQIGEGGMGQVYRARDTKLHRNVALKILPDAFSRDPDRLARFTREAQTLAALNHPNIAHIHGFENFGGVHALVMELVEGEDLSQRIARGAIPIGEALLTAKQIAEALEAAHEQGIIHRDLKPANIKVREDGTVKVLDFGLAKALEPAGGSSLSVFQSPTITTPAMTQAGMILGTAAYMSPEQAKGKPADKRSDVWAFGAVLFEMLTGTRAFRGEDVSDTLANVLKTEPDWGVLPSGLSPSLVVFTTRCLHKDSKQRLGDIHDMRLALEGAFDTPGVDLAGPGAAPQASWRRAVPVTATVVFSGLVGGLGMWAVNRPVPPLPVHLTISHPETEIVAANPIDANLVVSPDGRHVAYVASAPSSIANMLRLYIRPLDQREPTLLSTSARTPFFSPNGQWVGFVEGNNRLSKVAMTGGPSFPIGVIGTGIRGASWGSDDMIVFATEVGSTGLLRLPAAGGIAEVLTTPDLAKGEIDHQYPDVLPGARAVLFTILNKEGADHSRIAVLDLETRTWRDLIEGGSYARYVASGHIVYGAAGTLRAVAFDLNRLEVRGAPVPVLDGVVTKPSGAASFSVSPDGTLVYVRGRVPAQPQTLVWVDRMGREETLGTEPRLYSGQTLSPDGTRVAVTIEPGDGIEADVWVWSLLSRNMTRLTFEPGEQRHPLWNPDGTRIVYESAQLGLFWRPADGTGVAERLLEQGPDTRSLIPNSWSAEGRLIFAKQDRATGSWDLGVLQVAGDRTAMPLLADPAFDERQASVSPDGRWMAYESFESARFEIYVRPFPNVDTGKQKVSSGGGFQPTWSTNSRTLFFRGTDGLMASTIQIAPTLTSAAPERVLSREDQGWTREDQDWYSVSRDGTRFLMLKKAETAGDASRAELNVIQNWFEDLKRLVPTD